MYHVNLMSTLLIQLYHIPHLNNTNVQIHKIRTTASLKKKTNECVALYSKHLWRKLVSCPCICNI